MGILDIMVYLWGNWLFWNFEWAHRKFSQINKSSIIFIEVWKYFGWFDLPSHDLKKKKKNTTHVCANLYIYKKKIKFHKRQSSSLFHFDHDNFYNCKEFVEPFLYKMFNSNSDWLKKIVKYFACLTTTEIRIDKLEIICGKEKWISPHSKGQNKMLQHFACLTFYFLLPKLDLFQ